MEASATGVHICPPSDSSTNNFPIGTDKFPARTAPDEYVFTFGKSSMEDPSLPPSGAPYSKQVPYTVVKSFLNDVGTYLPSLKDLQNCFTRIFSNSVFIFLLIRNGNFFV